MTIQPTSSDVAGGGAFACNLRSRVLDSRKEVGRCLLAPAA